MADSVLINKAAMIERACARARDEYAADPDGFGTNYTRQDAAILNVQRACEAAIDMGQHVVREGRLGVPQSSRDIFELLHKAHIIDESLMQSLQNMVSFRNIAVHDYQKLLLPVLTQVIQRHLGALEMFSETLLKQG